MFSPKLVVASSIALAAAVAAGAVLAQSRPNTASLHSKTATAPHTASPGAVSFSASPSHRRVTISSTERASVRSTSVIARPSQPRRPAADNIATAPESPVDPTPALIDELESLQDELWALEDDMRLIASNPRSMTAAEYETALERMEEAVDNVETELQDVEQALGELDA